MPNPKYPRQQNPTLSLGRPAGNSLPPFHHFEDIHHAIQHFFSFFEVKEANALLHQLFHTWAASKGVGKGGEHDRMVFFYKQLRIVLEASFLLQQERIKNGAALHCHMSRPPKKTWTD